VEELVLGEECSVVSELVVSELAEALRVVSELVVVLQVVLELESGLAY
jgi:hypothetical protein